MEYFLDIAKLFLIYSMLTISLNYLLGNVGIMYVGHIAFFAIGAYSVAVFTSVYLISPFLSILLGIIIASILSFSLGIVTARMSGHYLLIASLGICEIVRSLANNIKITGGAEGISISHKIIESLNISSSTQVTVMIIILFLLEIIFFYLLDKSPKGRIFKAVRDDKVLATIYGFSINKIKTEALVISGIWASIAGSLFAYYSQYIDPSSFTIMDSLILLVVIIIGGIGSLKGSLLGAALLIILPSLVRLIEIPIAVIAPLQQILMGIILIVLLIIKPKGIFGKVLLK